MGLWQILKDLVRWLRGLFLGPPEPNIAMEADEGGNRIELVLTRQPWQDPYTIPRARIFVANPKKVLDDTHLWTDNMLGAYDSFKEFVVNVGLSETERIDAEDIRYLKLKFYTTAGASESWFQRVKGAQKWEELGWSERQKVKIIHWWGRRRWTDVDAHQSEDILRAEVVSVDTDQHSWDR